MKLVAGEVAQYFKVGAGVSGFSSSLGLAFVGVGHLVGLSVGIAMLLGLAISWGGLVPYFSQGVLGTDSAAIAGAVFKEKARFIGAGTIGVAAIWTLLKIIGPIIQGLKSAFAASAARAGGGELVLTERDIPIKLVGTTIVIMLIPIAFLLWQFLAATPLAGMAMPIVALTIIYILLAGVVIASVCGYMAGLIGASNSPISGVGILAVVGASLMLLVFFGRGDTPDQTEAMIAYALFATAIVFGIATISNDNLQDLKTGQIVGATPWRQQVALIIGVIFGSLAIPPVLDLLNNAFGFAGAPGAGANALAAPQAMLISALGKGVLGGDLDWPLLGLGALIGVIVVLIDEALGKAGKMRLPPLGVGMGVYLPMALTFMIVVGTVLGHFYDKWSEKQPDPETAKRMGVLGATGLIVGESLFGVLYAGIVAGSGSDAPLAVVSDAFEPIAMWGGIGFFAALVWWIYRRMRQLA